MSPLPGGPLEYFRAGYSAPRTFTRGRYAHKKKRRPAFMVALEATTSASTSASTSMSTSASTTRSTTTATVPPPGPPFDFDDDLAEPVVGGIGVRARAVFLRMLRVNNAGDYADNPVVAGVGITARLHKHEASETLLKCWTTIEQDDQNVIVADLTERCTVEDETITVDIVAGVDLRAGFPAVLNVIHFTTTSGHSKGGIFCADEPRAMVLLDGYNADAENRPAILRITGA